MTRSSGQISSSPQTPRSFTEQQSQSHSHSHSHSRSHSSHPCLDDEPRALRQGTTPRRTDQRSARHSGGVDNGNDHPRLDSHRDHLGVMPEGRLCPEQVDAACWSEERPNLVALPSTTRPISRESSRTRQATWSPTAAHPHALMPPFCYKRDFGVGLFPSTRRIFLETSTPGLRELPGSLRPRAQTTPMTRQEWNKRSSSGHTRSSAQQTLAPAADPLCELKPTQSTESSSVHNETAMPALKRTRSLLQTRYIPSEDSRQGFSTPPTSDAWIHSCAKQTPRGTSPRRPILCPR